MARVFAERLFGVPWSLLAIAAMAICIAYLVIDTSGTAIGWRWVVLRWFHSLCWLFLALAALLMTRLLPLPAEWAKPIALAGGCAYGVFLITSLARES